MNLPQYEVLDVKQMFSPFNPEDILTIISLFATQEFAPLLEELHKAMFQMDRVRLYTILEKTLDYFTLIASKKSVQLIRNMGEAFYKVDWRGPTEAQKENLMIQYVIFLQKCQTFKRELEDCIRKSIDNLDIEGKIQQVKTEFSLLDSKIQKEITKKPKYDVSGYKMLNMQYALYLDAAQVNLLGFSKTYFKSMLDELHKAMMEKDLDGISKVEIQLFAILFMKVSIEMSFVIADLSAAYRKITSRTPPEEDWVNLVRVYIVFLENYDVLKSELEDFTNKKIELDIQKYIKQIKRKYLVQEIELEEEKTDKVFCSGCQIF